MIELGPIKRHNGVAGQIQYNVEATYPGEEPQVVAFVGSVYGGPVVMILPSGTEAFVHDPGQYGEFGPQWVRNFFARERA